MAESATDGMNQENVDDEIDIPEDPFPPVEPFPSAHTDAPTCTSVGRGNGVGMSKKRKRDEEFGELVRIVDQGFGSLSAVCAKVDNLSSTIGQLDVGIAETKKQLSGELFALGFDRREVIKAVRKLGNSIDLLEIWSGMDDEMKKELIMDLLRE